MHFLDALRGIAAFSVMLYHFYSARVSPIHDPLSASLPGFLGNVISNMYIGVEIFFVLSGFVIAYSMDLNRHTIGYAGNFILRRSLRLDPPYWSAAFLMLAVYLIQWPTQWHDFYLMFSGYQGILSNMFYVQNLGFFCPAASILDVSWTLCLEVQFYLSYLLILVIAFYASQWLFKGCEKCRKTIVGLALISLGIWSFVNWSRFEISDFSGRSWMFFMGVGAYHAMKKGAPLKIVLPILLAAGLYRGFRADLEGAMGIVAMGVIYTVGKTGQFSTFLATKPLLWLGRISYSLYLTHLIFGLLVISKLNPWIAGRIWAAWLAWSLGIAVSLLTAYLLHRLVEAPSNNLSQRLKRKTPAI